MKKDGMKGKEVVHCDDVTSEMVAKSRVYGNPGRWQKVLHKMMNKEKVKIAVLGGSVTAGHECLNPGSWRNGTSSVHGQIDCKLYSPRMIQVGM